MVDAMDQSKEPLAWRLRNAAIERTNTDAERVDDYVLDEDGVIDLRALEVERDRAGASVADPAPILATMRGKFGDAGEVSDLYDTSERPEPRWRLGLRARHTFGDKAPSAATAPTPEPFADFTPPRQAPTFPPLSRIELAPLSSDATEPSPPVERATETAPTPIAETIDPEIDLRDEDRPTAECPQCAGLGRRDLFDRFSQIEFYSCDHCHHMWQQDVTG